MQVAQKVNRRFTKWPKLSPFGNICMKISGQELVKIIKFDRTDYHEVHEFEEWGFELES